MNASPSRAPRGTRIPLRVTLVALLVGLLTVALLVTGFTATSLLRDYLHNQQSDELEASADDIARDPWEVLGPCMEGAGGVPVAGYLACLPPDASGRPTVVWGPVRERDSLPDLVEVRERLPEDDTGPHTRTEVFTVPAGDRSTAWQVAAVPLPQGYTAVVATDLSDDEKAIGRLVVIEAIVGLVVLVVLASAGYVLVRNSLRPLTEVERTARAIADGDLSQRVPVGDQRTEVGRLSTALNGMLARIEAAFRAQQASEEAARGSEHQMRRFVADASHELRTPLTSIRGFAELYRQGAVTTDEDVARLMQRIEAEGARMGLLVEDLLLLARLDQQRPLTFAPVDLAEVAGDVVHDAKAVQPDRPISLRLDESLTDVPVVIGDEGRLRQVVGNLVTNALTHTPRDVRVTVTVAEAPDDADVLVLRVSDDGPGMDPADAARAFERFYRVDASRTRRTDESGPAGGTGLGLAIVSSLVAAHGGRVDLDTAPGQGAAFTVRLPRSGPGDVAGQGAAGSAD